MTNVTITTNIEQLTYWFHIQINITNNTIKPKIRLKNLIYQTLLFKSHKIFFLLLFSLLEKKKKLFCIFSDYQNQYSNLTFFWYRFWFLFVFQFRFNVYLSSFIVRIIFILLHVFQSCHLYPISQLFPNNKKWSSKFRLKKSFFIFSF